jgi:hypothetical protein
LDCNVRRRITIAGAQKKGPRGYAGNPSGPSTVKSGSCPWGAIFAEAANVASKIHGALCSQVRFWLKGGCGTPPGANWVEHKNDPT